MLASVGQLSNNELLARVKSLAKSERQITAALIAYLAELEIRGLHLAEGYSSLFTYCTQVLRLSEHAAYGRIEAARMVRRFPVLLDMLEDGWVNLTTVRLLGTHLTAENHRELLGMARHKSKRQVEELLARLCPQPPVSASVRRLPTGRHPEAALPAQPEATPSLEPNGKGQDIAPVGILTATRSGPSSASTSADLLSPATTPCRARPAVVTPLAPQRYKVQFTASPETVEKFRLAQALLRHQIPDGDPAAIFDRALTAQLEALAKQKLAATARPRGSRGMPPGSRHIPAKVKRGVWLRDGGRCAFVSQKGYRCTEDGFLEFHHVVPYAAGGETTIENIQLRCRAHNGYEAELYFGLRNPRRVGEAQASYLAPAAHSRQAWAGDQGDNSVRTEFASCNS